LVVVDDICLVPELKAAQMRLEVELASNQREVVVKERYFY
jgi:hypothetical protein